jgi:hypothetical protein
MIGVGRVRAWLARVCSVETMTRIVDPTLADMRVEAKRPRWRGYVSLLSALTMHAVTAAPFSIVRVYVEDERAVPRALFLSLAAAVLLALPFAVPFVLGPRSHGVSLWIVLTLLPQALAMTLPAALLIGVPPAMARSRPSARLIRRVLMLAVLFATLTFGVIGWVVPAANQAFRVAASGMPDLPPGRAESSLAYIRSEAARMRTFHGGEQLARQIEFEYEIRLALAGAAVPLGMLAIAVALTSAGRRHPYVSGVVSLTAYALTLGAFSRWLVRPLLIHTTTNVGTIAWVPNAALILTAGVIAAAIARRTQVYV